MISESALALKSSDSSKDLWLCRIHLYTHPLANTSIHTVHVCMLNTVQFYHIAGKIGRPNIWRFCLQTGKINIGRI